VAAERLYFPIDEYQQRWTRVQEEIVARGYETAVIWGRSAGTYERYGDIHYLTGFYSTHSGHEQDTKLWNARSFAAAIMQNGGAPELHTDEADTPADMVATEEIEWHWDPVAGVADALKRRGITGKVALVGSDFLPVKYYQQLVAGTPNIEWVPEDQLVEKVRQVKSPRELDCYREAGEIATVGLDTLFDHLLAGKTEAESAAAAAYEVIKRGGAYHMIPISHGDRIETFCRNPLTGYSLDAPKPGDMVRGWVYGPIWQGYWLDPGRTSVCDPVNAGQEQKDLIGACANIVDTLIEMIKPGQSIRELCDVGDRLTDEAGGEKDQAGAMWPIYGHGVGHFWQFPWIGSDLIDGDEVFEENMVLGIEAFLAHHGVGSAGFEQNLIVTADGSELLTKTPMLFW
jgi:Xaa-Pro aminopeptidase